MMKRALFGLIFAALVVILVYWTGRGGSESKAEGELPKKEHLTEITPPAAPETGRPVVGKPPTVVASKLEAVPPLRAEEIIKSAWGGASGQFGRKKEEEANSEAPMAILAGAAGEFAVVDQVNQRVQRFKDGKVTATIPTTETVQDIASAPGGKTVLLDRLSDQKIQVFDAEGKLINEAPITGKGLPAGGNATGVFADDDGIWVENDHGSLVRVADPNGNADEERPEIPGRPSRDGKMVVTAAIQDRAAGKFVLTAFERRTFEALWSTNVELPLPIMFLMALETDDFGFTYVAANVGREASVEPFAIIDEQILVVRVSPAGQVTGMISLPVTATGDEMMRPLSVSADGSVYLMSPSEQGMAVNRYTFP